MSQCIRGPLTLQTSESQALRPLQGDGPEAGPRREACPAGAACGAEAGIQGDGPRKRAGQVGDRWLQAGGLGTTALPVKEP